MKAKYILQNTTGDMVQVTKIMTRQTGTQTWIQTSSTLMEWSKSLAN